MPGKPLGVTLRITNVSRLTRKVQIGYPENLWFVVRIPHERKYDSRFPFRFDVGGPAFPVTLKPGESVTRHPSDVRVSWSGPLRITAAFNNTLLPTLNVPVAVPSGRLPSDRAAMAEVVASTSHLLDNCRPREPGVPVTGWIKAPNHGAPPMRARCSVGLARQDGFIAAQVLISSPPDYRGVRLDPPYEMFTVTKPIATKNREALAWLFVVTHDRVMSTDSASFSSARAVHGRTAPDWEWTTKGYRRPQNSEPCGWGLNMDGYGHIGPDVTFVSACSR